MRRINKTRGFSWITNFTKRFFCALCLFPSSVDFSLLILKRLSLKFTDMFFPSVPFKIYIPYHCISSRVYYLCTRISWSASHERMSHAIPLIARSTFTRKLSVNILKYNDKMGDDRWFFSFFFFLKILLCTIDKVFFSVSIRLQNSNSLWL